MPGMSVCLKVNKKVVARVGYSKHLSCLADAACDGDWGWCVLRNDGWLSHLSCSE